MDDREPRRLLVARQPQHSGQRGGRAHQNGLGTGEVIGELVPDRGETLAVAAPRRVELDESLNTSFVRGDVADVSKWSAPCGDSAEEARMGAGGLGGALTPLPAMASSKVLPLSSVVAETEATRARARTDVIMMAVGKCANRIYVI